MMTDLINKNKQHDKSIKKRKSKEVTMTSYDPLYKKWEEVKNRLKITDDRLISLGLDPNFKMEYCEKCVYLYETYLKNMQEHFGGLMIPIAPKENYKVIIFGTEYGVASFWDPSVRNKCKINFRNIITKKEYIQDYIARNRKDISPYLLSLRYKETEERRGINARLIIHTLKGEYETSFSSLKNGINIFTMKNAVDKRAFFISNAKKRRGEDTDYTLFNYGGAGVKGKFICKKHNYEYTQKNAHHLQGHDGCPFCAKSIIFYDDNRLQQHKEYFNDIQGTFYMLYMFNEEEAFGKMGITSLDINKRIRQIKTDTNYKINVLYLNDHINIHKAYKEEREALDYIRGKEYEPKQKFSGYTECFREEVLYEIYKQQQPCTTNY